MKIYITTDLEGPAMISRFNQTRDVTPEGRNVKLAVLGDVHANLPALEAVLDHLRDEEVGRIVHTGDIVGLGPFPVATVRTLRRRGVEGVRGNFDEATSFAYEWPAGTMPDDPAALELDCAWLNH